MLIGIMAKVQLSSIYMWLGRVRTAQTMHKGEFMPLLCHTDKFSQTLKILEMLQHRLAHRNMFQRVLLD